MYMLAIGWGLRYACECVQPHGDRRPDLLVIWCGSIAGLEVGINGVGVPG